VDADVVSLSLYKPWGESRGGAGTLLTDYGFNGQRSMEGTIGLQYFNARWYDSSLGRWTQPDSILPIASQGVQAWDRYEFTNNNSMNFADSTGHSVDCGLMEPNCKHTPLYEDPYYNYPRTDTGSQDSYDTSSSGPNPSGNPHKNKPPAQPALTQQCVSRPLDPCPRYPDQDPGGYQLDAWIWGISGNASDPGLTHVAGIEGLLMISNNQTVWYTYGGEAETIFAPTGGGADAGAYIGGVFNLDSPESYQGPFSAITVNVAVGDGLTVTYFWDSKSGGPFTPKITQGFSTGYYVGTDVSVTHSNTYYVIHY
jgi:RHS repeat-associated protein